MFWIRFIEMCNSLDDQVTEDTIILNDAAVRHIWNYSFETMCRYYGWSPYSTIYYAAA